MNKFKFLSLFGATLFLVGCSSNSNSKQEDSDLVVTKQSTSKDDKKSKNSESSNNLTNKETTDDNSGGEKSSKDKLDEELNNINLANKQILNAIPASNANIDGVDLSQKVDVEFVARFHDDDKHYKEQIEVRNSVSNVDEAGTNKSLASNYINEMLNYVSDYKSFRTTRLETAGPEISERLHILRNDYLKDTSDYTVISDALFHFDLKYNEELTFVSPIENDRIRFATYLTNQEGVPYLFLSGTIATDNSIMELRGTYVKEGLAARYRQ